MSSDQENSAVEFQFIPPRSLQAGWLCCRLIEADDAVRLYEAVMASIDHLRPWMPWVNDYRRIINQSRCVTRLVRPPSPTIAIPKWLGRLATALNDRWENPQVHRRSH